MLVLLTEIAEFGWNSHSPYAPVVRYHGPDEDWQLLTTLELDWLHAVLLRSGHKISREQLHCYALHLTSEGRTGALLPGISSCGTRRSVAVETHDPRMDNSFMPSATF